MLWPEPRVRQPRNVAVRERVADARRASPEAEPWLALVEAALAERDHDKSWDRAVPVPASERPANAPLLDHTQITLDGARARRFVRRLVARALPRVRRIDAVALLEAAVAQDESRVAALARAAGIESAALRVTGQIATLPLLQACGRALGASLPPSWWEAYCPVCGAWPTLAEYAGLDRKRQLRCGRCGTAWGVPALRCVFCDETNHESLAYLTLEGAGDEARKIEVCSTCKGYLKATTTVRPLASWAVLLDDLSTVHLDIAALDRGYARPERPGHALDVRIVERRRAFLGLLFHPRGNGA